MDTHYWSHTVYRLSAQLPCFFFVVCFFKISQRDCCKPNTFFFFTRDGIWNKMLLFLLFVYYVVRFLCFLLPVVFIIQLNYFTVRPNFRNSDVYLLPNIIKLECKRSAKQIHLKNSPTNHDLVTR